MNDNPTPPIRLGDATTANTPATRADQAVAAARDVPDMLAKAQTLDPDLAAKWTGTALAQSKTMWGMLAALAIAEVVRRYSLGWDANTQAVISGAVVMAAAAFLRCITSVPITGWFTKATVADVVEGMK